MREYRAIFLSDSSTFLYMSCQRSPSTIIQSTLCIYVNSDEKIGFIIIPPKLTQDIQIGFVKKVNDFNFLQVKIQDTVILTHAKSIGSKMKNLLVYKINYSYDEDPKNSESSTNGKFTSPNL